MKMFAAAIAATGMLAGLAGEVSAEPMGREAYSFPSRSGAVTAQLQMLKKTQGSSSSSGGSAGGAGSVTQYVTNYNTTSTSVGNWNEITQILDNGAQGYIGNNANQTSSGNQGSTSTSGMTTVNSSSGPGH